MSTLLTTADILKELGQDDCQTSRDNKLSISSKIIRCSRQRLVAVGGEQDEKRQISALLDALHWDHQTFKDPGPLRFVVGRGKQTAQVLQAIATLLKAMEPKTRARIKVEVNFQPVELNCPDFTNTGSTLLAKLQQRDAAQLPPLADQIRSEVDDPAFRWYRTATSKDWSGRVHGLEVCKIRPPYTHGTVSVGSIGKKGDLSGPRRRFLVFSNGEVSLSFDEGNRNIAVALIRQLATDRDQGTLTELNREHLLESQMLRSELNLAEVGPVIPVTAVPFQFPTFWSAEGNPKFVDILMRAGPVPWVLELKVQTGGGQGMYYRHAIGQAVLYRAFIRQAKALHAWFQDHQLDPTQCQAAFILPELQGPDEYKSRLLDDLTWMASLFDVAIFSLPVGFEKTPGTNNLRLARLPLSPRP